MSSQDEARQGSLGEIQLAFIDHIAYDLRMGADQEALNIKIGASINETASDTVRQISVTVEIGDEATKCQASLRAVVVLKELPHFDTSEELNQHAARVGAPIAYGQIREELLNLSCKGPFHRLILPPAPVKNLVEAALMSVQKHIDPSTATPSS